MERGWHFDLTSGIFARKKRVTTLIGNATSWKERTVFKGTLIPLDSPSTGVQTVNDAIQYPNTHTHTHAHIYIYIYIHTYIRVVGRGAAWYPGEVYKSEALNAVYHATSRSIGRGPIRYTEDVPPALGYTNTRRRTASDSPEVHRNYHHHNRDHGQQTCPLRGIVRVRITHRHRTPYG